MQIVSFSTMDEVDARGLIAIYGGSGGGQALHELVRQADGLECDLMLDSYKSDPERTPPLRQINDVPVAELEKRIVFIASVAHEEICQTLRSKGYRGTVYIYKPEGAPVGSSTRIKKLAAINDARNYLEIGVAQGKTFLNVDLEVKYAVDPQFRFASAPDCPHLFEMTSDHFFTNHCPDIKFDVIFLDGLHTFEQTFRDFCNSLLCSHDRTLWLIDDTVPIDIFGAARTPETAAELRRMQAGVPGGGWQGDVYKIVFAIRDFFPAMSYCTIIDTGNPQTLVWKSPRKDFSPLFNSLERIERLDYFQFMKLKGEMNAVTDQEAFAMLPVFG